jgi:hypothetical protein
MFGHRFSGARRFRAVNIFWLVPWPMLARMFPCHTAISVVAARAPLGLPAAVLAAVELCNVRGLEQRNRYLRPICAPGKTSQPTYPGNVRNAMLLRGRLDGTM